SSSSDSLPIRTPNLPSSPAPPPLHSFPTRRSSDLVPGRQPDSTPEVMRRRQSIVVLALVGLLIATSLWLHKIGVIGVLQCGTGACESVQTSRYAELFGVPVAFVGVAGYAVLFVVGLVGLQPSFATDRRIAVALATLSTAGL